MKYLTLLTLFIIPVLSSAGTIYKTIGPDGKVIYSDKPSSAGGPSKTVSYKSMPASPLPASVLRYQQEIQQGLKNRLAEADKPIARNQVTLFTAPWCGYCRQAKSYLGEHNIPYTEYNIDTPEGMKIYSASSEGSSGIPLLLSHGQRKVGFSREGYDSLFSGSR